MKHFTFLRPMLLLCALIVGVGSSWAQEEPKVTYDLTSGWSVSNGILTDGNIEITGSGPDNFKMNTGYFFLGKSGAYITLPTYSFTVEKIVVTGNSGASASTKMNVYVGETAVSTETTGSKGTNTYEIAATHQAAGNAYTLKVTSDHNAQITKIKIYEKASTPAGPVDPTVTFENDAIEVEVGETATNDISKPNDLNVIFTSNNEKIASVNDEGIVTGVAIGTATITASWDAVENKYNAGLKSYTVNVIAAVEGVTYEKVTSSSQLVAGNEYILVTEAGNVMGEQNSSVRKAVDVTINDNTIKIKDEAVAVLTLGGKKDQWTFTASDNKELIGINSDSNRLDASSTYSTWVITDDYQVKNVGLSTRYIQYNYNSGNPRFAAYKGTQTKSYLFVKSGSASDNRKDSEISFATTSYTVSFDETDEFVAPTLANPHSLTVTYESSDENLAVVNENTGEVVLGNAEGTVTITAIFAGNEEYKAGIASYTIHIYDPNVKGSIGNPFTVAEVINGTATGIGYVKGFITGYVKGSSDPVMTSDITSDTNFALSDTKGDTDIENNIAVQLPSGALRTAWNLKNNDLIGVEVLVKGSIEEYFKPKKGVKSPEEIIAVSVPATVTEAGWATWVAPFNVEVPSGVEAYYVTEATTSAKLTEVIAIPAGEPVLLKNEGSFDFTVCDDATVKAAELPATNLLQISTESTANGVYVLANSDNVVGFYTWAGGQLGAGRVYLPKTEGARDFLAFSFGEATAIKAVENAKQQGNAVYNLAGQRVAQPTRGLYIMNGKKVVLK